MSMLNHHLKAIAAAPNNAGVANLVRGIEKESLRVTPAGKLATSPHPSALGSALTHSQITTDYSESLLEFITQPSQDSAEVLKQLHDVHAYTYQHIGDERLWVNSMPCMLGEDNDIPIARYGTSNSGTMKSAYRLGLGHRYGRSMQTIAGIHYNFSVSDELWEFLKSQDKSTLSLNDFKTQGYFKLIRNFRRYFWLLLYLFGASPGVCKSFVRNRQHSLVPFNNDSHSLHTPYATSLRMGDLGYQSSAQESLIITYNCLGTYTQTLCKAITQTHPEYANIGVKDGEGNYKQLSDKLLQIENEFYSVIRPKRTAKSGETALSALVNGGVEYIEVRCLDLNPFEPVGISEQQTKFLDTFLLFCLLSDSPASDEIEYRHIQENQKRMVYSGRDPELTLYDQGKERLAREWGKSLMSELAHVALLLDDASNNDAHQQSLQTERQKLEDASLTPSARVLESMKQQDLSFYQMAMQLSEKHQTYFAQHHLKPEQEAYFKQLAEQSLAKQHEIEQQDKISFDDYLANYYSQYQCAQQSHAQEMIDEAHSELS